MPKKKVIPASPLPFIRDVPKNAPGMTDSDYIALDEAMAILAKFWHLLVADLAKHNHPEQTLIAVKDSMMRVHGGE